MLNSPLSTLQEENNQILPFKEIFEAQPGLVVLLSPQLTILAATDAYLRETLKVRDNTIGRHIFDIFPDNPQNTETAANLDLKASLEQVLSTGNPHKMDILRYDIPDPNSPDKFVERYWSTTNTPVLNKKGKVNFIIHETVNVSEEVKGRLQLEQSQKRERIALAQAEQQRLRLERLFDQAPAACAILEGPDFVFKAVNNAYQQLFPGREVLNLPLFNAFPEFRDQPMYDILRNVYNTGETYEGKEILIPVARYKDQPVEDIYWSFIYQALFDEQGQVNGVLIFALDVTGFVQARQQVEESAKSLQVMNHELEERVKQRTEELKIVQRRVERERERLENVFMRAPAAICILEGPELVYSLVNPAYSQLLPGRQLLGKPILEALPEIKDHSVYKTFRKVYETGITHEEPELLVPIARTSDGILEDRYFRYIQQARFNEQGQVDGVIVFGLEMTEQVRARKAVEANEQQLRLITDSLPVLISYLDKQERYRFANKAYTVWFNLNTNDILHKSIPEVIGEEAYENAKGYIKRALAGERVNFEAAIPYRGGKRHTRTSLVPDIRNGEVAGFYTLVTDVTDQVKSRMALEASEQEAKTMAEELAKANESFRQSNIELGKANKRLIHINADLDNFIYTASHDLKAPISNIEMLMEELLIELPQESLRQEEVRNILGMIKGAVGRFKKTIRSLTEISKLQKESGDLAEPLSIEEMVKEVRLDLEQIILRSGTRIEADMENCTTISFSEKNLRSIIYNLVSNAIKYKHPERESLVKISCRKEGEFIVLKVQDNGLGLSKVQQKKLFTMFRRFHDHVEGSGVGLYMVKKIVDNSGGKIEVDSEVGVGTTFSVYFRK